MNKKIVLLAVVSVVVVLAAVYTLKESEQHSHAEAQPTVEWDADTVREWYRKKSPNLTDDALSHITDGMVQQFMAENKAIDTTPVTAPASEDMLVNDRFVVSRPAISEAEMDRTAKQYKLEHALCSLNSATLNLLHAEYREDYSAVFSDLGIQESCESGLCGYAVQQGSLVDLLGDYGLQKGDQLLALNGVQLNSINGFQSFHDTVLSREQHVQLQVQREGQVVELKDYSCKQ